MAPEFGQYIPEIQKLGINEISRVEKDHMVSVFGPDVLTEATDRQREFAMDYLKSPLKRSLEGSFAYMMILAGAGILEKVASLAIEKIDPGPGTIDIKVGLPENHLTTITKIRTLKMGTVDAMSSPFEQASFQKNNKYLKDKMIPHRLPITLRRTGLDEVPQLRKVLKGEILLVGIRGYLEKELEANMILCSLRDAPELGFSDEIKSLLVRHPKEMAGQYKTLGIANLRSSLDSRYTTHMGRLFTDIFYLTHASPKLDFEMAARSLIRRSKGVKAILSGKL